MIKTRLDHELPECIEKWGWKYHHLGVLTEPNSHTKGIRIAMIEHNGAPVELIEFYFN